MNEALDRTDPVRAWIASVVGLALALAGGVALFPQQVYDGFIWKYFWGPVVADAHGQACAQRIGGETVLDGDCTTGIVAEPGYTTISTASYAVILLIALVGVIFLLRRLDVGDDRGLFFAVIPFVFFGGALRTVEDANIVLLNAGDPAIGFPASALLISPLIYVVVFAVTLAALVGSVAATDRGLVERYEYPLFATGAILLSITIAYLAGLALTMEEIGFEPMVPIITLVGATVLAALAWVLTERYAPEVNRGTGYMGLVIVWGHAVDGVANVLSLDWPHAFGLPQYEPKHVVNAAIQDVTEVIQPAWLTDLIGHTWPFIPVKVGAALFVVWLFNDEMFDESPTYTLLLLIAVLAVGLGPGTRDFLRATFGI